MAIISFKCPNCDGELIFDPSTQKYKCEYCYSLFSQNELEEMRPTEGSERAAEPREEQWQREAEQAVMYSCPSCGAEIVTDETTTATFCYYCHNPVVLTGRLEGEYLPDKIIPFEIDRAAAEKSFLEYIEKKRFVPKAFFGKKQIQSMTGVYFPYWLYDVDMDGNLQAEARNIRVWRRGDDEYTETTIFDIRREGSIRLSNLPEKALKSANAKLAENILPYRVDELKEFHAGYLSGFQAERRDMEQTEVQDGMQAVMRDSAEKLFRETVSGYNSVSVRSSNFVPQKEKWQYVLFPVWTITYKGRNGKIYYYSMNGQTGKICGELPVDYGKLTFASSILAVAVLMLGLIGGFFL